MENNENFSYSYSAKEQDEIKKIRDKYISKSEDKMEQLRRLDKSATQKGTVFSIVIGIIGALILGFGMSCCLVWTNLFAIGIVVGVVGIIIICTAYPIYNAITKKEHEKIAPEIIRLTDELMK